MEAQIPPPEISQPQNPPVQIQASAPKLEMQDPNIMAHQQQEGYKGITGRLLEAIKPKTQKQVYAAGEAKMIDVYAKEVAKKITMGTGGVSLNPFGAEAAPFQGKIIFDGRRLGKMEFSAGSYGIIYKGETPVRQIPFVWQQDSETRQSWAVFRMRDFYNQPPPRMPWKRIKYPVLIIPFDKSTHSCEYYAHGYLAKFDEASISQRSMHYTENEQDLALHQKDLRMVSADLTLYRMLSKYLASKWNWMWIIIAVVAIAIVGTVGWYIYVHPQVIQQLTSMFHGTGL